MADTGDRKYTKEEALQRIFLILTGETETDDTPETAIKGEKYTFEDSVSKIAELMSDSLPGYVFHPPSAVQNDYGEIYAWTGTSAIEGLTVDIYTKITGSFQNTAYYDNVTCSPTLDRMTLSKTGFYFVSWSASFQGSSDVTYWIEPYRAATGIPQAVAKVKPSSSGSSVSLAGSGIFRSTAVNEVVDLRVRPDTASAWFTPNSLTLTVYRIGEYNA